MMLEQTRRRIIVETEIILVTNPAGGKTDFDWRGVNGEYIESVKTLRQISSVDLPGNGAGAKTQPPPSGEQEDKFPIKYVVLSEGLNVRSGPGPGYKRVGGKVRGDKMLVFEILGGWARISPAGSNQEWVSTGYIAPIKD